MTRIYKNWLVHNTIAHPIMGVIMAVFGLRGVEVASWVHDVTLPDV